MAYIEFEDVKKIYGTGEAQVRALDGVSFQVEKGEFVVLLGSSGAGKTTLLNMLGGMDTITEGKILFDGRDISHMSGFEMARYRRHDVGFVFQFYNLIPYRRPRRWIWWASVAGPGIFRPSSPAASSSGWPLPGPLPRIPGCFCAMSQRVLWTM